MSIEQLDVEGTLHRLPKRDLTFKGEKTAYATHNLHAFAAKFPPQLPRLFIHELTHPGEWVLVQWPVQGLRWSKPCSPVAMLMHFSISQEMTPMAVFLDSLQRERGRDLWIRAHRGEV